jgi:hypothetical protein
MKRGRDWGRGAGWSWGGQRERSPTQQRQRWRERSAFESHMWRDIFVEDDQKEELWMRHSFGEPLQSPRREEQWSEEEGWGGKTATGGINAA